MKINLDKKKVFIAVFLFYLGISSFCGIKSLLSYYINDTNVNNEWSAQMNDHLEMDFTSVFAGKNKYVELNGLIANILGQRQMNGVVKLNNGYLTIVSSNNDHESEAFVNIKENAESLKSLKEYLDRRGTKLLCVVVPGTVNKYDTQLPVGIQDHTDDQLDYYTELLDERDIEYIDLREEIAKDNIDHYSLYYKTDHHWNIWGGLYATKKIINKANIMLEDNVDAEKLFDLENYNVDLYPEWHLGSRGQRVGRFFAKPDDFEIMYPKYETEITRCSDNFTGSFKDVFICRDPLSKPEYSLRYTYDTTYKYSVISNFVNNAAVSDKKIYMFSDSMGRVVTPCLSLAYKNVFADANLLHTAQDIDEFEELDPDLFVILLYPNNLTVQGYLDFGVR